MPNSSREHSSGRNGGTTPPQRVRILLAEDDHDVLNGIASLLSSSGYDVQQVSDGGSLLDAVTDWLLGTQGPPADALVTDVRMPGINGLSLVEGLRAQGFEEPIVVMSAFGDAELRARVAAMPGVAFLPKPFEPRDLEDTLAAMLSVRDQRL